MNRMITLCFCLICGCRQPVVDMAAFDSPDDTLVLVVGEPKIVRCGDIITHSWPIKVCDSNGVCDTGVAVFVPLVRHKGQYILNCWHSQRVNVCGDLNNDGKVNFRDFAIMAGNWLGKEK